MFSYALNAVRFPSRRLLLGRQDFLGNVERMASNVLLIISIYCLDSYLAEQLLGYRVYLPIITSQVTSPKIFELKFELVISGIVKST